METDAGAIAASMDELRESVIEAIRTCYDPEIPVNIYDLGLIYGIDIDESGNVDIQMTLTSPGCPVAGTLPGEVQARVAAIPEVTYVNLDVVWDPPWTFEMMSEESRLQLGIDF